MDNYYIGQVPASICDIAAAEFRNIDGQEATVKRDVTLYNTKIRDTTVKFAPEWYWFNGVLHQIGIEANYKTGWNYNITQLETIQYAEYKPGQHYKWHIDTNLLQGHPSDRRTTVICAMNDMDEYTGGQLQIKTINGKVFEPELNKGDVIVFPSFLLHRVTPVKSGIRYSATMWLSGPAFR